MAMNLPSGSGHNRRGRGSRAPISEINVTPFVDVMLVLLIIFMVTAPLLVAGVPVELPDSRAKALEQEKEPIQISIDKDGGVYLGEDAIDDDALIGQLSGLCAAETPPQVMLRGDRAIDYGRMMQIMGELNRAGCNSVSLVTTGSSESQ